MDKKQDFNTQDENQQGKDSQESTPKTHLSGSELRNFVLSSLRPDGEASPREERIVKREETQVSTPARVEEEVTDVMEEAPTPEVTPLPTRSGKKATSAIKNQEEIVEVVEEVGKSSVTIEEETPAKEDAKAFQKPTNLPEKLPTRKSHMMTEEEPLDTDNRVQSRQKEDKMVGKIVKVVVLAVIILGAVSLFSFYRYVQTGLAPLNAKDTSLVQIEIPSGSSTKGIGEILQKEEIISSAFVFNYYMKINSLGDFKAGYYQMSPSMTLDEIAADLKAGGTDEPEALADGQVIVPEGKTIEDIGDLIEKNTGYKKADFLALMKNEAFFNEMVGKYPNLLTSAKGAQGVRYYFEGYLFPAKYNYYKEETLQVFVEKMITQMDLIMSSYYEDIAKSSELNVHRVLTLASLVEREGVTDADRRKIAQVFMNRIAADMPLQSDIAVLYALNTHKTQLTNEDVQVDSPYNLYVHTGYGPGPFDNPGENAIDAVMQPEINDYLYFVADIDTGKVYFAKTYDEHLVNKEKYVDSKE